MTRMLGVCSWSLQPESPEDLAEKVREARLAAVQLALDPIGEGEWALDRTLRVLASAGIAIRSGMMRTKGEDYSTLETIRQTGGVRPDEHWDANRATAERIASVAAAMNLTLVSFHAGFLPPEPGDPLRTTLVGRLQAIADIFARRGIRVAFETGQETAGTLVGVLTEIHRPNVGVNFDPANMILYDHGDPIDALRKLAPHVMQIHIKDARRTWVHGQWGEETPVGEGEVDWPVFFEVVRAARLDCDLMLERESGSKRLPEIQSAADQLRAWTSAPQ